MEGGIGMVQLHVIRCQLHVAVFLCQDRVQIKTGCGGVDQTGSKVDSGYMVTSG